MKSRHDSDDHGSEVRVILRASALPHFFEFFKKIISKRHWDKGHP